MIRRESPAQRRARLNLSDEEKAKIRADELPRCIVCGGFHAGLCPFAQEVEMAGTNITRVVLRREFAERIADIVYDSDVEEAE